MKKPNEEQVKTEIKRLRAFIEDESNDPLERRIAQIKEDTLRWCVEATDWESPSRDFGMAALIAREMKPTHPERPER